MSSTKQVLAVIEQLRTGAAMTLSEALRAVGISVPTFRRAMASTPELVELYDEALQESYDLLAEKLVHVDEYYPDAKMANAVSTNIRWFLSRRKPSTYGEHSTIEHRITADKDVLEALLRAKARAQSIEYTAPPALPHPTRAEATAEARSGYLALRDAIRNRDITDIEPDEDDTDISVLL